MQISDFIKADSVFCKVQTSGKKNLLQILAGKAAELTGLNERDILQCLLAREKLGTTGVGQGVAIPHGKFAALEEIHGLFATTKEPIDFESVDDAAVDIVCLLLAPEESGAEHLKALAKVSTLLRNPDNCERLREAETDASLFELLSEPSESRS